MPSISVPGGHHEPGPPKSLVARLIELILSGLLRAGHVRAAQVVIKILKAPHLQGKVDGQVARDLYEAAESSNLYWQQKITLKEAADLAKKKAEGH